MAAGIFKSNSAGWKALAIGPEVAAVVSAEAARALPIAEGLAAPFTERGEYASSFDVRTEIGTYTSKEWGAHPVVVGILENTSPHAAAVEYGNEDDHRAHHVLSHTMDAMASG